MVKGRKFFPQITLIINFIIMGFSWQNAAGQASISSFIIFEEDGGKGILDARGKEVIPAKYYDLGWTNGLPEFHNNIIGYRETDAWGLINSKNKIITPPKYSRLYPASNSDLIVAALPGRFSGENFFGLINSKGKVAIPFMYGGAEVFGDVVIIKTLEGSKSKYGIVNMANQPILPFQYLSITPINKNLIAVTKANRKVLLINSKGKEVIRYELDSILEIEDQFFKIYNGGKVGLMTNKGELITSPVFKKIEIGSAENTISYLNFNRWDFLKPDGVSQPALTADEIKEVAAGVFRVTLNNQSWLVDEDLNKLSILYDKITPVSETHFKSQKGTRCGLLNFRGEVILEPVFDSLILEGPFVYASRNLGNKIEWNIYDTLGIQKNHFKYQEVKLFSEGLISVKRNNKWGFMNREGVEMIPCGYDEVTEFQNGKSVVNLHGEEGLIDLNGNWLVFPSDKKIIIINDSLLLEKTRNQDRLVNLDTRLIYFTENELTYKNSYLSEKIDSATTWNISLEGTIINTNANNYIDPIPFYDSLYIIYQGDNTGVVSSTGREIVPFGEWDEIYPPTEEFLGIKDDNFYGFIDLDNKLRIANRYEGIGPFTEGLAAIKVRGKWGFIDKRETIICQPLYNEVKAFKNGISVVRSGDHWGLMALDGRLIQPLEFDSIEILKSGFMLISKENSYGLLDIKGQTILVPKYEELEIIENKYILVKRRGEYGLFDSNGVNLLPTIYHKLSYCPHKKLFLSMTPGNWETQNIATTY